MNPSVAKLLSEIKSTNVHLTIDSLIGSLSLRGVSLSESELWDLCYYFRKTPESPEVGNGFINPPAFPEGFEGILGGFGVRFSESVPPVVAAFAVEYFGRLKPKALLAPWIEDAVFASVLLNKVPSLNKLRAISGNPREHSRVCLFHELAARTLSWSKVPDWSFATPAPGARECDPSKVLQSCSDDWDAVFCFPPLSDSWRGSHWLLHSAAKLSRDGVGVYVVPTSLVGSSKKDSLEVRLKEVGVYIEAVLSIPRDQRRHSINLSLVTVRRSSQNPLFSGELQSDAARQSVLIRNLLSRTEAAEFALGMLVKVEGFKSYEATSQSRDYQLKISRQGSPIVNLADLLLEINALRAQGGTYFSDRSNAIYLPVLGNSEVVTSPENFRIKPYNYLQLVLKQELVSAEFLAKFLNSDLGLHARRCMLSGSYIAKITVSSVKRGVPIPLPSLVLQGSVIVADASLRDLATDIEGLRKRLWGRPTQVATVQKEIQRVNREETFEEWLKTLPFPLASILWNYHIARHDPKEQFELLLKFFEGLAEFNATILMSAAKRDSELWSEVRAFLSKYRSRFETSSFGTWVELTAFISKRLRELRNSTSEGDGEDGAAGRSRCEAALGSSRGDVLDAMLSKDLLGVLRAANQFRNDFGGHYGVLGSETAANLLVQLRSFLSDVRRSFGQAWENYQMLLPTNRSEWTGQHHEVVVNVLQGLNTPFLKETRKLAQPLKRNTLYLLDKDRDSGVELLPLLKISNAPKDAANACYFYNRKQSDGARYVSYHFEKQADMTFPAAEVDQLFSDLFGEA